jgi:hypothetical protein
MPQYNTCPMQFPLLLPLTYKNISPESESQFRYGLYGSIEQHVFNADQPLKSGVQCEISIGWPVLLENDIVYSSSCNP